MTVLDSDNKEIELHGMAPEAKLYGFKVLMDNGNGEDAFIIKALDIIADIETLEDEITKGLDELKAMLS